MVFPHAQIIVKKWNKGRLLEDVLFTRISFSAEDNLLTLLFSIKPFEYLLSAANFALTFQFGRHGEFQETMGNLEHGY